jgi:hypothetical protein
MPPDEFVAAAEAFISLVDSSATLPLARLVDGLERRILDLYVSALKLEPGLQTNEEPSTGMSGDEQRELLERLSQQFDDLDHYSTVFDPLNLEEGPVIGSLADDVADIYSDLKDGLAAFRDGDVSGAVFDWWVGFNTHWGRHAVQALPALRLLRAEHFAGTGIDPG